MRGPQPQSEPPLREHSIALFYVGLTPRSVTRDWCDQPIRMTRAARTEQTTREAVVLGGRVSSAG